MRLAFSSDRSDAARALSTLAVGARAVIVGAPLEPIDDQWADRLAALGVTAGAVVTMLQRFPGVVFLCDQTELAVERAVADAVFVRPLETSR